MMAKAIICEYSHDGKEPSYMNTTMMARAIIYEYNHDGKSHHM